MSASIKWARNLAKWTSLVLSLFILSGCQTLQDTEFSPVEVRLDSQNAGGVQHLILVNSSGKALHHYQFRAYIWGHYPLMLSSGSPVGTTTVGGSPNRTYTGEAYGNEWRPGEMIRFNQRDMGIEARLILAVLKVQVVGSCDEGSFRETWQITSDGQLKQIAKPQRAQ